MQQIVEIYVPYKISSVKQITALNRIALDNGIKSINVHGHVLELFDKIEDKTKVNLNLEFPHCSNNIGSQLLLIKNYYSVYEDLIEHINISIPFNILQEGRWDLIKSYWEVLTSSKYFDPKRIRLGLDCVYHKDDDEIVQIIDLASQYGFLNVNLFSTNQKLINNGALLLIADKSKQMSSVNLGVFMNTNKIDYLEMAHNIGLSSFIILPKNIFNIFDL